MPLWLTLLLLAASVLLWTLGAGNSDDVIGLLERILAVGVMAVVLIAARPWPLELAGVALALWLPRAREDLSEPPDPRRREVLIPF